MVTEIKKQIYDAILATGFVEKDNILMVIRPEDLEAMADGESFPVVGYDVKFIGMAKGNGMPQYEATLFVLNMTANDDESILCGIELNSSIAISVHNNCCGVVSSSFESVKERDEDKGYAAIIDVNKYIFQ